MFSDARSTPPRVAAVCSTITRPILSQQLRICARIAQVLFIDGGTFYCDMPVPEHLLACFGERSDGQIMGLEILSIALGPVR